MVEVESADGPALQLPATIPTSALVVIIPITGLGPLPAEETVPAPPIQEIPWLGQLIGRYAPEVGPIFVESWSDMGQGGPQISSFGFVGVSVFVGIS